MLRIIAQPLDTVEDMRAALQNAIALEHATIPPYLTAVATLSGTSESVQYARDEITEVVVEEMLHMTLACNVLNAIGGHPAIADPAFVPIYPGPLPMGIGGDLIVHLRRYSQALVEDTFMKIEEPETILDIPERPTLEAVTGESITIGEFYAGIRASLENHPEWFTGDPKLQVSGHFTDNFAVTSVETALLAIDTIVEQGEGTSKSPLDLQHDVAHYYSFQQFSKGMRIVHDESSGFTVSFDPQQPITIDDMADVIQMVDDPQTVTYDPADQHAEELSNQADASYSKVLKGLQRAFNGEPTKVGSAIGAMFEFESIVDELLHQRLTAGPHAGLFPGPRFRFVP